MSNDISAFTIWSAVIVGVGLLIVQDTDFEKQLQKQIDEKKAKTL